MSDENRALPKRWFDEVWNEGRAEAIDEMFPAHGIAHGLGPSGRDLRGPQEFKIFHKTFRGAFPDIHITVDDVVCEGDKVAARFSGWGTHLGANLGIAPTKRRVVFAGMTILRVEKGRIQEAWNNFNLWEVMEQLGVVQPLRIVG